MAAPKVVKFPESADICCNSWCICEESGYYCKPDCCALRFDQYCDTSFTNCFMEAQQQCCCSTMAATIPINPAKVKAGLGCFGIKCVDFGPDYKLPMLCCQTCAKPEGARASNSFEELCCRSACICCVLGFRFNFPDCCSVKVDGKGNLDPTTCFMDAKGQSLCYNLMVSLPNNETIFPMAISYMGLQCFPSCACEACTYKLFGTFPTAKNAFTSVQGDDKAKPEEAVRTSDVALVQ